MGPVATSLGSRKVLGHYEICYADGSACTVDIAYGHHVAEWDRRHGAPLTHGFHRHAGYIGTYPSDPMWQGKTVDGRDVTLYGLEWRNPRSDKKIHSVRVVAAEAGSDAALIVVAISGISL